ncbi:hypothetical protein [Streptococcus suis]|uniref:hypothetical protein n=3 Tax=Streptococcus suis TaxID=1307 RepID=UPI001CF1F8D2|nr:hypothetical protein [Streptococcus suis]MDW8753921.1 hypothetical protein [Streptococcus suis]MDX5021433.1 hypothetical protein [Streptococcus suis]MDY7609537.1 hypothetical protein [Streptococcus suis]
MMEEMLKYAEKYLEDQLYIIDNEYLNYDLDLIEHPDWENLRDWVIVDNPRYVKGVHDNPYYRAEIANDLDYVRKLLGR